MIKVPTDLLAGEGSFWFIDRHLHKEPSHDGRGEGALRISFIRGSIPFVRASPSRPSHLPKAPFPNTITLGLGFQHMNFRRIRMFNHDSGTVFRIGKNCSDPELQKRYIIKINIYS